MSKIKIIKLDKVEFRCSECDSNLTWEQISGDENIIHIEMCEVCARNEWDAGNSEGREESYDDGYNSGYDDGLITGREECDEDAENRGYEAGFDAGYNEALETGIYDCP